MSTFDVHKLVNGRVCSRRRVRLVASDKSGARWGDDSKLVALAEGAAERAGLAPNGRARAATYRSLTCTTIPLSRSARLKQGKDTAGVRTAADNTFISQNRARGDGQATVPRAQACQSFDPYHLSPSLLDCIFLASMALSASNRYVVKDRHESHPEATLAKRLPSSHLNSGIRIQPQVPTNCSRHLAPTQACDMGFPQAPLRLSRLAGSADCMIKSGSWAHGTYSGSPAFGSLNLWI
jgi:hypothetical protein